MTGHPVHFAVERPGKFSRMQLLVRVVVFFVLGLLGISFGWVFAFAYVALPALAAARLSSLGSPGAYVFDDGPRVMRALHWYAALCAWAGLIVDRLPARGPDEVVTLSVEGAEPHPTVGGALLRIITGLPSALVLMVLCWLGVFVWLWAALTVLLSERVGPGPFHYLVGLQRWSVRLLAYQASLIDRYPPFSFTDSPPALPTAQAAA